MPKFEIPLFVLAAAIVEPPKIRADRVIPLDAKNQETALKLKLHVAC